MHIKIKIFKKNLVINSIKGFFQIYKESTGEFTTIPVTLNIQNCMLRIMTTPEALLGVNQYIVLNDKFTEFLIH